MSLAKAALISFWIIALCFPVPRPAQAHKLLVSAVVEEGNSLMVRAFFPDGSPAQEIPVTLTPESGTESLTLTTDRQGMVRFPGLKPGRYRVSAGDPLGHRGETVAVIPGTGKAAEAPGQQAATQPGTGAAPPAPPSGEPVPWGNILAGLGFVFGLAAFVMVLKLRADLRRHASGN